MPDYTSNLNLYLPGGGGSGTIPDEIADIDKLNENFRLIDASMGGSIVPAVAGYVPKFNGELAYIQSTKSLLINDGGVTSVRGTPLVASEATRDLIFPAPEQGDTVFRTDKGWEECYYSAYNAVTNIGGATPAGWYPVSGALPEASAKRSATAQALSIGAWTNYSATALWTPGPRHEFAAYDGGWLIPITGRYLVDAGLTANAPMFGGVSLNPGGTGRASLEIEGTTGSIAFSLGRLSVGGYVYLDAGQKLYIKATATDGGNLSTSTDAKDAGRFNLRYVGPKRG